MKKLIFVFALYLFVVPEYTNAHYSGNQLSVNFFYGELAPFGEWIEISHDYFVWRPASVHYNWSPYTLGRWSWTHYGWYWESYEPFGWATYHYGRWYYDDYYGWVWVPDSKWGPSWVEWRYSDYYVGWAPLPPYAVYRPGVGIHFTISWHSGYHHWNFVNIRHFHYGGLNNYLVSGNYRSRIFNRTKYRTNYYEDRGLIINGGIDRSYVEKRGGYKLKEREVVLQNETRNRKDLRIGSPDRIIDYRPSNSQISETKRGEFKNIVKSERSSTLKIDRIELDNNASNGKNSNNSITSRSQKDIKKPVKKTEAILERKAPVKTLPDKDLKNFEEQKRSGSELTRTYPQKQEKEAAESTPLVKNTSKSKKISSGAVNKKVSNKSSKVVSKNKGINKEKTQKLEKKTVSNRSENTVKKSSKNNSTPKR